MHKALTILFSMTLFSCNNYSELNIEYPPGGYDFSKTIVNRDFYCYPLIDKMSRRDSFYQIYHETYFFKLLNEPNISLEPSIKPIVRLTYRGSSSYIISLTEQEIIVKSTNGDWLPRFDFNKLTEVERLHFSILLINYPLDETKSPNLLPPQPPPGPEEEHARQLDSIKKNTPILLKREYFDYLLKKAAVKTTVNISTKKIKISREEFINFIRTLNESGYWNFHYNLETEDCSEATDSGILSLEMNTGRKYNYVEFTDACLKTPEFFKVCKKLLQMSRIDDSIIYLL